MVVAEREYTRPLHQERRHTPYRKRSQQRKTRKLKKGHYILLLVFIGITILFILSRFATITEKQYKVEKLRKEIETMEAENERLRVEIANLKSMSRIEKIAQSKLNMKKPNSYQIIYLKDN